MENSNVYLDGLTIGHGIDEIIKNTYQSPIRQIETVMKDAIEDAFMKEIKIAVGLDIDKNELIRALKYDREQYQKGYEDAKANALQLIIKYVPDDDGTCSKAGADLRELLDEIENL